ncbi:MAG: PRC-barrel domain-containing protein [Nanoarchaeota archaeon]|nr:PRC-barrel domain-containing protein [Nanoarchaeota archaeon]
MALKLKTVSSTYGLKVYTDSGAYFGEVEEAIIQDNRIIGWRVKAGPSSNLSKMISGARGAIIQHSLVRAIEDIFIISSVVSAPSEGEEKTE